MSRRRIHRPLVAVLLAAALSPGAAHAFPAGSTELVTRPSGDLPLVAIPSGKSGLIGTSDGALQGGHQTSQDGRYVVFVSDADGLSTLDVDTVTNVYVRDTQTNETELVSRASGVNGAGATGQSGHPQISDDGQRVVFDTTAPLDPSDTNANSMDIYVRDLVTDTTYLAPDAGVPLDPSIDADGSHVAYVTSDAHDAVNDTNGTLDVYVWQVGTASFELASRLSGANTAALNAVSTRTSLSDSGTIVAFETDSAQLDAGDTNGASDVAVRSLSTASSPNITVIASRASTLGGVVGDGESTHPALAGDGSSVAFVSASTNLIGAGADTNAARDVFRRSLSAGFATTRVSVSDGEAQLANASGSNLPSISDNGDLVAFTNFGIGIAPDDGALTNETVYLRSITAATTEVVSRATGTGGGAPALFGGANSISGDGRTVAFAGTSADYSSDDDDSRTPHVYARRLNAYPTTPNTTHFLDRPTGTAPFTGASEVDDARLHPGATSWDGRFVGFTSDADNVVPGQDNAFLNAFVRDTVTGTTEQLNAGHPGSAVIRVALAADGRSALYVPDGTAYVRDLDTETEEVVSRADGPSGAVVTAEGLEIALSGDGSRAAFVTSAALDPADTNGVNDVYVRDLGTDDTILASRADDEQGASGASSLPSLNWDGTVVAFASVAANLVGAGADANGVQDVFVRDLAAGTTVAASRADGAAGALGGGASTMPAIDGDGDTVAFATESTNFGGPGGTSDVAVRELATADTTAFGSGGAERQPAISDDGRRVALVSNASLAAPADPADTTPSNDVYVYDRDTSTFTFASRATTASGIGGDLASGGNSVAEEGPSLSGNGDCVVFPSTATNLDPDWSGTGVQLGYLRTIGSQCPDTTAPDTTIDDGPSGTITTATPSFSYSANEARVTFACALDGGAFGDCATVLGAPLSDGPHTVQVRATDVVGNPDPTPAQRAFTVDLPDTPQPPAPAAPGTGSTAPSGGATTGAVTPRTPAKLKVLRAGVDDGTLDMLVEITSSAVTAGADLDVAYSSSGKTTRFSVPLSSGKAATARRRGPRARAAEQRISIRRRLPSTQPKDTGIVEITYAGNSVVSPDEVRLRAADVKASLVRKVTTLSGGRLKVEGTISAKARGVVRLRLGYDRADGTTGFEVFTATIAKGTWKVDRALTGDAAKGGYLSIQFTGYEPENMRGEQTGKAVP